jgi:bifunctional UDP-N-acetylglucosamine pyrophosphorylase / glucosamine-1-phosphate N-acetyltransferase
MTAYKNPLAVVILAAGKGTRMKSDLPKVLHPLLGRPMLEYVVKTAKALKPQELIIVVGHQAPRVRAAFPDLEGSFVVQSPQLGTGHALQTAQKALPSFMGTVLVLSGDVPLIGKETLQQLLRRFRKEKAALALISTILQNPFGYGRILRDSRQRLLRIVEEKDATPTDRSIQEINTGLYCFDSEFLFSSLSGLNCNNRQKEYYLTDLVHLAAEKDLILTDLLHPHSEEVLGINDRAELARTCGLLRQKINLEWMKQGVTLMDPDSTYIEPTVRIGPDTVIGPFTLLRGKTKIGSQCHIYSHAVLEDVVLRDGETITPFAWIKPSCPAFWGVAPPNMKKNAEESKAYFRTKPSCHASDVTPRNMKTGSGDSKAYFRTKNK